jgi:hypothetical protein
MPRPLVASLQGSDAVNLRVDAPAKSIGLARAHLVTALPPVQMAAVGELLEKTIGEDMKGIFILDAVQGRQKRHLGL